jgi:hypothetical protein
MRRGFFVVEELNVLAAAIQRTENSLDIGTSACDNVVVRKDSQLVVAGLYCGKFATVFLRQRRGSTNNHERPWIP